MTGDLHMYVEWKNFETYGQYGTYEKLHEFYTQKDETDAAVGGGGSHKDSYIKELNDWKKGSEDPFALAIELGFENSFKCLLN